MLAKLEKPRDDYIELVLHHIITLWLIGASYFVNLTRIGVCVFVSMLVKFSHSLFVTSDPYSPPYTSFSSSNRDIPDFLLAISKCISYLSLETLGNFSFIVFMINWGYFRHYQNIRILNSVWKEFELIPAQSRVWDIKEGLFMPGWMRSVLFSSLFNLRLCENEKLMAWCFSIKVSNLLTNRCPTICNCILELSYSANCFQNDLRKIRLVSSIYSHPSRS